MVEYRILDDLLDITFEDREEGGLDEIQTRVPPREPAVARYLIANQHQGYTLAELKDLMEATAVKLETEAARLRCELDLMEKEGQPEVMH